MADYPGLDPDGRKPGGIEIAGNMQSKTASVDDKLTVGSASSSVGGVASQLYGATELDETKSSAAISQDVISIGQDQSVPLGQGGARAFAVERSGAITAQDYTQPTAAIDDWSGSTQSALIINSHGGPGTALDVVGDAEFDGKILIAAVDHDAAALSGKCIPIYDQNGVLLGYIPIYN